MSHHLIEVKDLQYTYPDGTSALRGISFRLVHGETVAMVGANGAGKSTLLLHLNGCLIPQAGTVRIGDFPLTKKTLPHVRRTVGMVFQDPDDQLFCSTVAEDVAFGPKNFGLTQIPERVRSCLDQVGLPDHGPRMIGQLSFGERKRVCLAGVLACDPAILVLDEPTANLDPYNVGVIEDLVRAHGAMTIVLVTHNVFQAKRLADRVGLLLNGKLIELGTAEQFFSHPIDPRTRAFVNGEMVY
jgi:cobalt/nickel transport system ATP-binding protein